MKISSYETEYICPICQQAKENKNFTPNKACSKAPTNKECYLQKRYNELICGLTLDHIQSKQLKTMFNALVEFIESQKQKQMYLQNGSTTNFSFQKFLSLCFLLKKKTCSLQNKRMKKKIKCFGTVFWYIIILALTPKDAFPHTQ